MECTVHTVCDGPPLVVSLPARSCAEDAVIAACRSLRVAPITRHLYALRERGSELYLTDATEVHSHAEYDLRVRFKVWNLRHLHSLDSHTYDYYFRQARDDVVNNLVPEIQYSLHKRELFGLGISDMYRAIQEDNKTLREVERNYTKYIPHEIVRKHKFFTRKPVHEVLERWLMAARQSPTVIKTQYLEQLSRLAPNYLSEEFSVRCMPFGGSYAPGKLQLAPYHATQPGLRFFNHIKNKWVHICTMDQLIFLGRKASDGEVEVCRKNGVPIYLQFSSARHTASFISGCSGYYRLMVKWTFNLSKDDPTPSLERLYTIKCHGPVGGEFSYHKLSDKGRKRHGCFVLRQCQHDYDVYYIDVCTESNTIETYKLEFKGNRYILNSDESRPYTNIEHLIKSFNDPEGRIYLKECLPASEYDKSQLLLCGEQYKVGVRIDHAQLQEMLKHHKSPRCINTRDILIFVGTQKLGAEGITATYKAIWKLDASKKMEVALKTLVREHADAHLKDFVELANKWASVSSTSIVKLYGVTLMSPSALVMEYLQFGPLNEYLRGEHGDTVKPLQLTQAAASLARALLDLSEAGCVHGRIRCSKVLLALRDKDKLTVKLSDPGLHMCTMDDDIHWIPVEFYGDLSLARCSTASDVWAFGTTLWEIFSYGLSPLHLNPQLGPKAYEQGHRLSCPLHCPRDIWRVILDCWAGDPHCRAIPQLVMRDISHYLDRESMSSINIYNTIPEPEVVYDSTGADTVTSDRMFSSTQADNTSDKSRVTADSSLSLPPDITMPESDTMMERFQVDNFSSAEPDVHNMQWIFGMGPKCTITPSNLIGEGYYGRVYKGILEREGNASLTPVALKQLKSDNEPESVLLHADFRKEIEVMKSLQHPNIVEILGTCEQKMMMVMEYLEHGALSSYLKINRDRLGLKNLLKYALDVASGMEYLSAKHLVHRDLAARNILVRDASHVKISDFGLARFMTEDDKYRMTTLRDLPLNWYSPEATLGEFSSASDVWSYGVTLWEMFNFCSRDVPKFDTAHPQKRAECFLIPKECPAEVYRRLMSPCWQLSPADRAKFIELVQTCNMLQATLLPC